MKPYAALDTARRLILETAAAAQGLVKPPMRAGRRVEHFRDSMLAVLDGRRGDLARRARTGMLMRAYRELPETEREAFFHALGAFDIDRLRVDALMAEVRDAGEAGKRREAEQQLRAALEPPRLKLFREFAHHPGGVKFVVDLRADLRKPAGTDPTLTALDSDLEGLLATWFDVGFLELRRVTWQTPAALLEKIAGYEAVHDVRGWVDLKDRLDNDRRCFCFFHPAMPDEPLIFVEVALVDRLAGNVQELLDPKSAVMDSAEATVAIFFSISNCQTGLSGISLGNALIKRVVARVSEELPSVRTFATLSPIPGFAAWLRALEPQHAQTPLRETLAQRRWRHDPEVVDALREPLLRLAARYLTEAKRPDGSARDPVAHFHLSNGARIERINWLADTSPRGLRNAAGMMVNYVYRLDHIDANQEAYATAGRIDASAEITDLLSRRRRQVPLAIADLPALER